MNTEERDWELNINNRPVVVAEEHYPIGRTWDWTLEELYQALGEGLTNFVRVSVESGDWTVRDLVETMFDGQTRFHLDQLIEIAGGAMARQIYHEAEGDYEQTNERPGCNDSEGLSE